VTSTLRRNLWSTTAKRHTTPFYRYLGYSREDWQRSIALLCYMRMYWNMPSIHYGQKRKQDFFRQYWAGRETAGMLKKVETHQKDEMAKRRADFITMYREIQSQSGAAEEIADSLLAFRDENLHSPAVGELRNEVQSRLERYSTYISQTPVSSHTDFEDWDPNVTKQRVDIILDTVGPLHGPKRNIRPEEFVPNPFLTGFTEGSAASFLQQPMMQPADPQVVRYLPVKNLVPAWRLVPVWKLVPVWRLVPV